MSITVAEFSAYGSVTTIFAASLQIIKIVYKSMKKIFLIVAYPIVDSWNDNSILYNFFVHIQFFIITHKKMLYRLMITYNDKTDIWYYFL